jgi:hypothetical protein
LSRLLLSWFNPGREIAAIIKGMPRVQKVGAQTPSGHASCRFFACKIEHGGYEKTFTLVPENFVENDIFSVQSIKSRHSIP